MLAWPGRVTEDVTSRKSLDPIGLRMFGGQVGDRGRSGVAVLIAARRRLLSGR